MGSLFSSPSKQANQVASATGQEAQQTLGQAEGYYNQAATNQQNAIANIGQNPFFTTGITPNAYQVNPNQSTTFGSAGPGTTPAANFQFSQGNTLPSSALNNPLLQTQPVDKRTPTDNQAAQGSTQTPSASTQSKNPFSSGSRNTAALVDLLGAL